MKKKLICFAIAVSVGLACYLVEPIRKNIQQVTFLLSIYDVDAIKGYILSFGLWAPIISCLLMIFQALVAPLPAFLITFANAALFGWIYGALLSWSSAMLGALLCFYIAKFLGRGTVERLTSKSALIQLDNFFAEHGKYAILIARLLPFISFDIVSYGAGLTTISLRHFLLATGLGQLPATIIYSYAGEMLVGSSKTMVFGLLILFAFSTLALLMRKIYINKKNSVCP